MWTPITEGWEARLVATRSSGQWRILLCEVLWREGKVVLARPYRMPFSAQAELWHDSFRAIAEAAAEAEKKPSVEADAGLIDWKRL